MSDGHEEQEMPSKKSETLPWQSEPTPENADPFSDQAEQVPEQIEAASEQTQHIPEETLQLSEQTQAASEQIQAASEQTQAAPEQIRAAPEQTQAVPEPTQAASEQTEGNLNPSTVPQGPSPAAHAVLVIDPDSNYETDSAFGDCTTSSHSISLASSIRDYKYENGRRYHAYREGHYPLPNDEQEQDRLDLLHHVSRMVLGGDLYRAPITEIGPPQRVLDIGTGTGIWAIDMADEFPSALVIGTDLSPIQPGWAPPNCKFYVDDAESDWLYPQHELFDFIHGRGLCGSIGNWPKFYHQIYQNLKPGGYIEMQEYECWIRSDDDSMERAKWVPSWIEDIDTASTMFGKKLNVAGEQKGLIEAAGFINVTDDFYKVPIGGWAKNPLLKETGRYGRVQMVEAVEPYTVALFTRVLGRSLDATRIVMEGVKQDLTNPKLHLYIGYHFVWGRKPF